MTPDERLDGIIAHVKTWTPAGDGFLDDLTAVRADLDRLRAALERIRQICDTDRKDLRAEYGSEFRAYMTVIPAIIDTSLNQSAALGDRAAEEGR